MRLPYLFICFLLVALAFSSCVPSPSMSVATSISSTATELSGLTQTPIPTSTLTATPTPLPTIGVAPTSLHGVSIQVWEAFTGPASDLFTSQVAQFNSDNQWGIVVNPTGYGDYTSLFDAMSTALSSRQTPDLVAALPEQTLTWDADGKMVDLKPYIYDPQWGLGVDAMKDIPSIFWAQDAVKGKQLGLPAQRSARFIFYNQTWAQELGFANPPKTADEFRQQACAANASFLKDTDPKNDGYGGWIVDTNWQTTYSWLLAFDGSVVDGSAYTLRTDPNLAALQFIKSLFDSHCAWISTEPTPFDSFARRSALFISGDLASLSTETDSMTNLKSSDTWTVLPFPGPQENALVAYGPSYSVMKSTPEKQLAAWLFARWLLSPENQAQWVESTGLFPLRNSILPMVSSYRQASPQWDAAVEDLSLAQDVPQLASWRITRIFGFRE